MIYINRLFVLLGTGLALNFLILLKLVVIYHKKEPYNASKYILPERYHILDRNDEILAISVPFYSVYIDPSNIYNPDFILETLKKHLQQMDIETIKKKWEKTYNTNKRFIWIARHIDNPQVIEQLDLPDVHIVPDIKRTYPQGITAAHLTGMVDVDLNGLAGVEHFSDTRLKSGNIKLTIDARVQSILYKTLLEGMHEFSAKAAQGIIVNAETGDILAMVSLPTFDPTDRTTINSKNMFDRNTIGVYEFGSIMKTANLALGLKSGQFKLSTIVHVPPYLPFGRFKIKDIKNNSITSMSVLEGFIESSNKCNALMALAIGEEAQQENFRNLGFFDKFQLGIPIAHPLYPRTWSKGTLITSSYGYGIAVTSLHVARAFARMVTGKKIELRLFDSMPLPDYINDRIFSDDVVKEMHYALQATIKKAHVPGLFVAGKSGTANMRMGSRYIEKYNMTTFVGIFPILSTNPKHEGKGKYIIMISLENPTGSKTGGWITGGQISAPIVKRVIEQIGPILEVYP